MNKMWEILILILGIPIGYLIAYSARDELKQGRRWFKLIVFLSLILGIMFWFFNAEISYSLFFLCILSFVSLWKSTDKKWIKL